MRLFLRGTESARQVTGSALHTVYCPMGVALDVGVALGALERYVDRLLEESHLLYGVIPFWP